MDLNAIISMRVRELRGDQSLRDFGDRCGVSHTTIDTIEKGVDFRTGKEARPTVYVLNKIATACGVKLSYLLQDDSKQSDNKQYLLDIVNMMSEEECANARQYAQFLIANRKK